MTFLLPSEKLLRSHGQRQTSIEARGCGCHQQVAVVRRRIAQRRGLDRLIQRIRAAKRSKCLVFDCGQYGGIDGNSAVSSHVQRENRKRVVMTREARPLRDKLRRGTLKQRQRPVDSRAGWRLSCQGLRQGQDHDQGFAWFSLEHVRERRLCLTKEKRTNNKHSGTDCRGDDNLRGHLAGPVPTGNSCNR